MSNRLGIRREDKNQWERRVPLTPLQVETLLPNLEQGLIIQESPIRAFPDDAYRQVGATVQEDLSPADVILAIKEIPLDLLEANKTYLFFSHTIKGQEYNMPLLQRLLDLNCQLIDYERVVDANNRRLIAFGEHAGLAGMIDTLRALGQRFAWEGIETPFAALRPTYEYDDLSAAQAAIAEIGREITAHGLPEAIMPLTIGVAGYGNVSRGAQEILKGLPIEVVPPADLLTLYERKPHNKAVYVTIFREEDTVRPRDAGQPFNLAEFFEHPTRYESRFDVYLPSLTVLVNCIYWDVDSPRLLTNATASLLYGAPTPPKLRVIGDISCDIEGGIEPTIKATEPDAPSYVWDPETGAALDGVAGKGPVIMAVDNLPCELPIEASTAFGTALVPFVPALAACDFSASFEACALPPELKRATIVYHGELTPDYQYLQEYLSE